VQYHESDLFHKVFEPTGGIRYLEGGVSSGFRPIDLTQGVNLYQIKGKRNPILLKVPASGASLNHGDPFILTSTTALYLWIGKSANHAEKAKAAQMLDVLSGRFKGVPKVRLDDSSTTQEFWQLLGGEVPIAPAEAGGADDLIEKVNTRRIYEVRGEDTFTLFAEGVEANMGALKGAKNVMVIRRGEQVVVYLPKVIPAGVKKTAVGIGVKFLAAQSLPNYYSVSVAKENVADETFEVIFA
jgi:hypothetical protein